MNYPNGMHELSNYDYHRADGVSRSQLMRLAKSPKHLKYYEPDEDETESMLIGTAVHTMLLEPALYNEIYWVIPNIDRRTREGKLTYNKYMAIHGGKRLLSVKQFNVVDAIVSTLKAHPLVNMLLQKAEVIEKSIFFTHESTGIQCKSRTDFVAGKASVNLKTTSDASYRAFQRSASTYGYFLQAAMTQQALQSVGINTTSHIIIAVETSPPYACSLFNLCGLSMDAGYRKFNRLMQRYQQVINSNDYDDYGMQTLWPPAWELDDE